MLPKLPKFCYYCAKELKGDNPPTCPTHRELWPLHRNAPCADAVVRMNEYVLLGLRAIEPYVDHWTIPGGHCDLGEHPKQTAKRETWEEFGVLVKVGELIDIFIEQITVQDVRQIAVYHAEPVKMVLDMRVSREFSKGSWFSMSHLPDPLTPHAAQALLASL